MHRGIGFIEHPQTRNRLALLAIFLLGIVIGSMWTSHSIYSYQHSASWVVDLVSRYHRNNPDKMKALLSDRESTTSQHYHELDVIEAFAEELLKKEVDSSFVNLEDRIKEVISQEERRVVSVLDQRFSQLHEQIEMEVGKVEESGKDVFSNMGATLATAKHANASLEKISKLIEDHLLLKLGLIDHKLAAGVKVQRFAILFARSAGSTWLMSVLNQQPDVLCYGEELPIDTIEATLSRPFSRSDADFAMKVSALEGKINVPKKLEATTTAGFKHKLAEVGDHRVFVERLKKLQVKVVFVYRENIVKHAISHIRKNVLIAEMKNKGLSHVPNLGFGGTTEKDRPGPVRVELSQFQDMLMWVLKESEEREKFLHLLDTQKPPVPYYLIRYEDMLQNPAEVIGSVYEYISGRQSKLAPYQESIIKTTPDDLRNGVSNFDELRSHYIGTPFLSMFDATPVEAYKELSK